MVALARGFLSDGLSSGNDGMNGGREREGANMSAVVCLCRSPPSLSPLNLTPEPEGGAAAADVMFRIQCKWMLFTKPLFACTLCMLQKVNIARSLTQNEIFVKQIKG